VGLLAIRLDPDVAGHLAVAVRRHREVLDRLGRASPPALAELEELLVAVARGGPEQSGAAAAVNGANVRSVDHDWLTPDECSLATGLSPRTIGRRIAAGDIRSSKIGRSRRINRGDLDQFMQGQRTAE
jgi:excisionase family DNA binding protein